MSRTFANVALVEDDASVRKAIVRLLTVAGFQTIAFDSAEAFLDASETPKRNGCVVIDINLPGLSGFELHERMCATASLPVVFITAHDEPSVRRLEESLPDPGDGQPPCHIPPRRGCVDLREKRQPDRHECKTERRDPARAASVSQTSGNRREHRERESERRQKQPGSHGREPAELLEIEWKEVTDGERGHDRQTVKGGSGPERERTAGRVASHASFPQRQRGCD